MHNEICCTVPENKLIECNVACYACEVSLLDCSKCLYKEFVTVNIDLPFKQLYLLVALENASIKHVMSFCLSHCKIDLKIHKLKVFNMLFER